jgi:hypothetical protein
MNELHWHTEDNPCLLCGVPVTPESWYQWPVFGRPQHLGGVIVYPASGKWFSAHPAMWGGEIIKEATAFRAFQQNIYENYNIKWQDCLPIFPPAGFAGKSDAELCREIAGPESSLAMVVTVPVARWVGVTETGKVQVCAPHDGWYEERDPAALILALTNAQVLACRLQEARNG